MHVSVMILLSVVAFLLIALLWIKDGMDKAVLKDIGKVSAIAVPVFILLIVLWPQTRLYQEVKEQQRLRQADYTASWYLYGTENPYPEESLQPPDKPIERFYFAEINWAIVNNVVGGCLLAAGGILVFKNRKAVLSFLNSFAEQGIEKEHN